MYKLRCAVSVVDRESFPVILSGDGIGIEFESTRLYLTAVFMNENVMAIWYPGMGKLFAPNGEDIE